MWDLNNKKKKKVIPDAHQDVDFTATEFLSAVFSSKNEKGHLMTLVGEPNW